MLRNCFPAMTGNDTPAMIHGHVLSILFALANSSAPALYGLAKSIDGTGCAGLPGCVDEPGVLGRGWRREGDRMGDEKERRYSAMKNISLKAQKRKRTVCL